MNKKEQLIENIMEKIWFTEIAFASGDSIIIDYSNTIKVLQSELPEDNEWDVVEIKKTYWCKWWKRHYWLYSDWRPYKCRDCNEFFRVTNKIEQQYLQHK